MALPQDERLQKQKKPTTTAKRLPQLRTVTSTAKPETSGEYFQNKTTKMKNYHSKNFPL